eukprot:m51a1_g7169 hypothetical protein (240) ;mRNA; f:61438-62861
MRLKGCGLQVLVGGKALHEYTHGGLTVVEARLDLPETREVTEYCETPHGVEEDAHWRVTPYELLLTNDNDFDVDDDRWFCFHEKVAELRIDYKFPAEIEDLGLDRESSGADPSVLPELLVSSVSSLLESVRSIYAALLLSDRLHFVVEALWNPRKLAQSDAEAVPQRLQAVARSFGVRLSLVEGRSRCEYAPQAVTATTRDVAVGWAGDRYVALVGSMAVPLIRSNKRSDPDHPPEPTA